jgi:hypothetical protein
VSPPSLSSSPPVLLKFGSIVNGALARVLPDDAPRHDQQEINVGRRGVAANT